VNCSRFEKLISLYIEADLAGRKSQQVENHLNVCPACRRFARELGQSQILLKKLRNESVDDDAFLTVQDRVLSALASREDCAQRAGLPVTRWTWDWREALVVGLVLLLGSLSFWKILPPKEPPSSLSGLNNKSTANRSPVGKPNERAVAGIAQGRSVGGQELVRSQTATRRKRVAERPRLSRPFKAQTSPRATAVAASGRLENPKAEVMDSQMEIQQALGETARDRSGEGESNPGNRAAKPDPLVVKLVTDDPEVVIVWLIDQNGGKQ
jgi:Putative zinc-finger